MQYVSAVLLCLSTLHLSQGLLPPAELAATIDSRYPYPDLHGNPCGIRQAYKDLDWYQRQFPLKTRQRTLRDLDALFDFANLVQPASDYSRKKEPSTAEESERCKKDIKKVMAHNSTLPEEALRRSLVHSGNREKMQKLFKKVLAGKDIAAVVLGGSISAGGDTHLPKEESYFAQATSWLASLSPVAGNNTFLNLARGATESTFYAHCLHDTLPKEIDVDLIIIEFAINDMRWDTRITPYMDNTKRRGLEMLIRKLLQLPSRPAILMLNLWMPSFNRYSFWEHSAEEELELLGKYYDLDILSWRNAVYPLFRQEVPGFKEWDYMCGRVHPNIVGHTYIADLVIGWMQSQAVGMLLDEWLSPAPVMAQESASDAVTQDDPLVTWQLSEPMLLDAKDGAFETCYEHEMLQQRLVNNQGWAWEDLVTGYGQHKAGYVSTFVGASIDFKINTAIDDRPNYVAMVGMGVLKSHAPMGAVRVSCVSGCACTPAEFDTHWDQKISLRQLLYFNATCHPDCVLRFTNAEYANSTAHDGSARQGHRLKLDTLVIMGSVNTPVFQDQANKLWQPTRLWDVTPAPVAKNRRSALGASGTAA